jgi:hypothetical protein
MALKYLNRPIGGPSFTPVTLDQWLNAQTGLNKKGHRVNLNLIYASNCDLNWRSAPMARLLGIQRIKTLKMKGRPHTWSQTQVKGGVFSEVAAQLRQGNLVIAMVPANPEHFVLITGWETWTFSGTMSKSGTFSELASRHKVQATKHRAAHYDGTMGDFIINDPKKGPETHLFATYSSIQRLMLVRPA